MIPKPSPDGTRQQHPRCNSLLIFGSRSIDDVPTERDNNTQGGTLGLPATDPSPESEIHRRAGLSKRVVGKSGTRAKGPAPSQPGPKRACRVRAVRPFYAGTSDGPGSLVRTRRGLKARSIGRRICARFGAGLSARRRWGIFSLGVAQGWDGAGPLTLNCRARKEVRGARDETRTMDLVPTDRSHASTRSRPIFLPRQRKHR